MSEFTVLVLRLAFFVLLWLFVFLIAGVLRQDLFGPRRSRNRAAKRGGRSPAAAPGPAPQSAAASPPPTASPPHSLVITSGAMQGMVIALGTAPITLGRSGDNTVVLEDDFASGHHARFVPSGGRWYVEDLGSTNGTFIGEQRLTSPVPVSPGTAVTVGHTTMELRS
ncbi:FHA domain-containing protein FhaB/FipA [Brevibacterium luteolum]|uniref:FHA domain-containing protein FhaB/FipA n=1 Tax=Brevibacterium luteolum TaxID=199591 RepID=UPI00223B7374|nr:FHA domain-containing protein [Brevibacterium luteolum]MCT1657122.1 FHA domain-containing protein [Brevibacterium luteolum]